MEAVALRAEWIDNTVKHGAQWAFTKLELTRAYHPWDLLCYAYEKIRYTYDVPWDAWWWIVRVYAGSSD